MDKVFLTEGKKHINLHYVNGLKELCQNIENNINTSEYQINFQNIFQKLLLHACTKNSKECIIFLINLYFEKFDVVTKIALRQSFFYGKYLIKDKPTKAWYNDNIIPLIRAK